MRWYRRAAKHGSLIAIYNLACLYRDRGDLRGERRWLRRCRALGDNVADLVLAEIELAGPRAGAAERARRFLRRTARSGSVTRREEAREILQHFERVGNRRWDPGEASAR